MPKLMLPWLVSGLILALGLVTPEDAGASGKMYWTDAGTDKIQRADLDGSNVEDIITTGLSDPGAVALDLSGTTPAGVPALGGRQTVLLCAALVGVAALFRRGRRLPAS